MDDALSFVAHWWLPLTFDVGAAAIGWRFRQIPRGQMVFWFGVGATVLTLILGTATTLWPEAVFGFLWG